jgi:hypothetical protein
VNHSGCYPVAKGYFNVLKDHHGYHVSIIAQFVSVADSENISNKIDSACRFFPVSESDRVVSITNISIFV